LIGSIFSATGNASFGIFAIAFYREHFLVSLDFTVAIMLAVYGTFIISALSIGRLVNRFGAKALTAGCMLISGVFAMSFFFAPTLEIALALNFAQAGLWAASGTACNCLVLDQVPQSRGTMLSLRNVCGSIGAAIGTALGGALLILFSYQAVGLAFGGVSGISGLIYLFLTTDPTRCAAATEMEP
jgi:predicted MFS family arabinose efflux permease